MAKSEVVKFKEVQVLVNVWSCIYNLFILVYLKSKGLDNVEVGIINAINIIAGTGGQLFLGYLCDLKGTIKKFMIPMLGILLILSLFISFSNGIILIIVIAILAFVQAPVVMLMTTWAINSSKETRKEFGGIRAFAALGYAFASLITGKLFEIIGLSNMFFFYAFFMLVTLISTRGINDIKIEKNKKRSNPILLFKNAEFMLIMIISAVYALVLNVMGFSALLMIDLGGTTTHVGISAFIAAFVEAPVYFGAQKLMRNRKKSSLLIFAMLAYIIRFIFMYFATSYIQLILLSFTQIITYGIFEIVSKYMTSEAVPMEQQNTAYSIIGGVSSILAGIYSSIAGVMIDKFTLRVIPLSGVIFSISVLSLVVIYARMYDRDKKLERQYSV
ncbi:MFS transporter [Clostridium folliculivorans]|uniref:Major facilitator superfamily associated domain-containing protein n=1 Tax=Clostridium folliculivorans TaxID=2886038 RepID=A0A9W5Y420_9CLOT|nr:MFS transporter [Clostridium folliculivorans]GKU26182.1 hypothetical protein CFOLD11_30090 [Clostridium folliculivorans]GKU31854.1 hypothetical protein CFB3_39620 [Clostridium folliculivorans]